MEDSEMKLPIIETKIRLRPPQKKSGDQVYVNGLTYFPTHNIFVEGGSGTVKGVRVWNYESGELDKMIKFPRNVNDIIKIDENTFLVGSMDTNIASISLPSLEKNDEIPTFHPESKKTYRGGCFRLLKLTSDLILRVCIEFKDLNVISLSTKKLVKKIKYCENIDFPHILLSKSNPSTFFIPMSYKEKNGLKQIDFMENEIVNMFDKHQDHVQKVNFISIGVYSSYTTWISRKNSHEIICCVGRKGFEAFAWLYDVQDSNFFKIIEINHFNPKCINFGSCLLVQKYLFFGSSMGEIVIYSVDHETLDVRKICFKRVGAIMINRIICSKIGRNSVELLINNTFSLGNVKVTNISMSSEKDELMSLSDLKERISFLIISKEHFCEDRDTINIKLGHASMKIPRTCLVL